MFSRCRSFSRSLKFSCGLSMFIHSRANNLFVSMSDGTVVCLGSEGKSVTALTSNEIGAYNAKSKIVPPKPRKKKKKKKYAQPEKK